MTQSITQDKEEHDLHDAELDSSSSLSIKITELDSSFRSQGGYATRTPLHSDEIWIPALYMYVNSGNPLEAKSPSTEGVNFCWNILGRTVAIYLNSLSIFYKNLRKIMMFVSKYTALHITYSQNTMEKNVFNAFIQGRWPKCWLQADSWKDEEGPGEYARKSCFLPGAQTVRDHMVGWGRARGACQKVIFSSGGSDGLGPYGIGWGRARGVCQKVMLSSGGSDGPGP